MCRGFALLANFKEIKHIENNTSHSRIDGSNNIDNYIKIEIIRDDTTKQGYKIEVDEFIDNETKEIWTNKQFLIGNKLNDKIKKAAEKWCKEKEVLLWKSFAKGCSTYATIKGNNNQSYSTIKGNNNQSHSTIKGNNNQYNSTIKGNNNQYNDEEIELVRMMGDQIDSRFRIIVEDGEIVCYYTFWVEGDGFKFSDEVYYNAEIYDFFEQIDKIMKISNARFSLECLERNEEPEEW